MLGSQVTLLNFMATPDGLQVLLLSYRGIVPSCLSSGQEGLSAGVSASSHGTIRARPNLETLKP